MEENHTDELIEANDNNIEALQEESGISADNRENYNEAENAVSSAEDYSRDYAAIARDDLTALKSEFPELSHTDSITELENPLRYASLRDLGLSPAEAYLATTKRHLSYDNRAHMRGSLPRAGAGGESMPYETLCSMRGIFSDISDRELVRLYNKVTKQNERKYTCINICVQPPLPQVPPRSSTS